MEVVHPRCCGLDVHKQSLVACLLVREGRARPRKEVRTFGTTTAEILRLADWLQQAGCTAVAMESSGVYWRPIFNLLEDAFTLLVVNAQHIKAVPGRKTDVKDAEWIAELLQHGLLRPSFIPPAWQREVRELTRYRTTLVRERAAEVNRIQKTLEGANIKLAGVASDVLGASGQAMLRALIAGETDPAVLAGLARGRLRKKRDLLQQALAGRLQPHHRFLLAEQLRHIEALDEAIARVSAEIADRLRPWEALIQRLLTIPGVGRRTAEVILAEIGDDMSRFPSAGHLASWAGLCSGQHVSAGKRQGGRSQRGSPWLRAALTEAAWGAARTKGSYLAAQYRRLAARRGKQRAIVATGHSILVSIYHMLTAGRDYADLGANSFDERARAVVQRRLVRRLEQLGLQVTIEPRQAPTPAA